MKNVVKTPKISAQMIVKNEERWVWYSIMSIIDYVDEIIIYDTGSTDRTVEIIKTIKDPKIIFQTFTTPIINGNIHTQARLEMFNKRKFEWVQIVDGDEIWTAEAAIEMQNTIKTEGNEYEFLIRPFVNLLGDVYHYQESLAGKYRIGEYLGNITIRGVNTQVIPGLTIKETYPYEAFFDNAGVKLQDRHPMKAKLMKYPFLHMTHLMRSSTRLYDNQVIHRNKKYKYEWGNSFPADFVYPKCFYLPRPEIVPSPWTKRSWGYMLNALWQTPLKLLKRRIFN